MPKSTTSLATPLREQLDRLAAFEPTNAPVLSLYLDTRPNQHGRAQYGAFLRKTFAERSLGVTGDARKSFDRDVERITSYLDGELRPDTTALAVFACAAADEFFEVMQLDAPIDGHWLFIASVPHLYPLARLNDQFPRYASLIVDNNSARLFVVGLGTTEMQADVKNEKTRRSSMGGWSQARYQRHIQNIHQQHMKEVADVLDRVVREEQIEKIVVACDDTVKPTLMGELPKHLADKVIDFVRVEPHSAEGRLMEEALAALREHDADTDVARVNTMLDAWHAGGLGVVGPDATLRALSLAQVEELLIVASPERLSHAQALPQEAAPGPVDVDTSAPATGLDPDRLKLADELVTMAQRQSARVRFIEDASLLEEVGGVGAILRFKIEAQPNEQAKQGE